MKSINLRAYFILDNLYEYNNIDFNEIISRIENENLNFIDLFPIFDFIFKKIYLFSRLELTSEEKANISRLFPKVTNFNRSFVFLSLQKYVFLEKRNSIMKIGLSHLILEDYVIHLHIYMIMHCLSLFHLFSDILVIITYQ